MHLFNCANTIEYICLFLKQLLDGLVKLCYHNWMHLSISDTNEECVCLCIYLFLLQLLNGFVKLCYNYWMRLLNCYTYEMFFLNLCDNHSMRLFNCTIIIEFLLKLMTECVCWISPQLMNAFFNFWMPLLNCATTIECIW